MSKLVLWSSQYEKRIHQDFHLVMSEEEAKSSADAITLRVRAQSGAETFFKVKKSTKLGKVFDAYATRQGVQRSSLRFMLDGETIKPDETPKMLELEDQDQIDAMLEQTGGCLI